MGARSEDTRGSGVSERRYVRRRHRRKKRGSRLLPSKCGIGAHFLNPDHVEAPVAVPSRRGE